MNHTLTVTGMTCGHCEKAVLNAILNVDAQAKVAIDRVNNRVSVETQSTREALQQAIAGEGYEVT